MQSKATTVTEYLAELPADRRAAIKALRKAIKANLPTGVKEVMNYGMIGYVVPHSIYPDGYHCDPSKPLPFGGLASQKNHISVYFMHMYGGHEGWFKREWARRTDKKLDMGKCCIRFRTLDDVPVDLIGEAAGRLTTDEWIAQYESAIKKGGATTKRKKKAAAKKTAKKVSKKKTTTKKAGRKKVAKKKTARKTTAKKRARRT
ncbi:MAG: DUF1801 domain-containing protein [Planctomycetota bacterium]